MFYNPEKPRIELPPETKLSFIESQNIKNMKLFMQAPKRSLLPPDDAKEFDLFASNLFRTVDVQDPTGALGLIQKRQRTPWWFKARENQITGSKKANAAGLFGLDGVLSCWRETYDRKNIPKMEEMEKLKMMECCAHGSFSEIDAVASVAAHYGVQHDMMFEECILTPATLRNPIPAEIERIWVEMFKQPWNEKWKKVWLNFLSTSPDIKGFYTKTGLRVVWELKAPYGHRLPACYKYVPYYYYGQCQLHMLAENVDGCYFASWSPEETRVWYVEFSLEYWMEVLPLLMDFHWHGLRGVPPTKLYDAGRTERVKRICSKKSLYLGSIPSVYCVHREDELEYWEGWVTVLQQKLQWPRHLVKTVALYSQLTKQERQLAKNITRFLENLLKDLEISRTIVHYLYL